jgi:3-dehydroquinate dehydratase/shikimate dehydrogenase
MDIKTKPKETTLLKLAMKKGCSIIYGYQMFIEQALGQFNLWFKGCFDIEKSRKKLKEKVLDCL